MMLLLNSTESRGSSGQGGVCVGSFGERLRREREMRGITLEEIAEATKIGSRSLRALEQEDFDKLPGGIFNKGFVRAYSRFLGINEEQAVTDYTAALAEAQAAGRLTRAEHVAAPAEEKVEESEPLIGRVPWGLLLAALVLVAVGFAGQKYYARYGWPKLRRERPAVVVNQPQAPAPAAAVTPPPPPVMTVQEAQAAPPELAPKPPEKVQKPLEKPADKKAEKKEDAAVREGFVLRIRARETAWVSITADGKEVTSGELSPNVEKTVRAQREIVLKTGNAGGVDISLNDKPQPPLGPAGEVRTVTFGPQGVVR